MVVAIFRVHIDKKHYEIPYQIGANNEYDEWGKPLLGIAVFKEIASDLSEDHGAKFSWENKNTLFIADIIMDADYTNDPKMLAEAKISKQISDRQTNIEICVKAGTGKDYIFNKSFEFDKTVNSSSVIWKTHADAAEKVFENIRSWRFKQLYCNRKAVVVSDRFSWWPKLKYFMINTVGINADRFQNAAAKRLFFRKLEKAIKR